ncbi:MAG: alpha/beta hydrolase [Bacteroidota bacterium]
MIQPDQQKQNFVDSEQHLHIEELGVDLYFRRSGTGPTLLLALHGYGLDGSIFAKVASEMDAEKYTLIAFDLPSHGKTIWPNRKFTPEDLVLVIRKLAALQPITQFHLIGFSYGGRISTKLIAHGHLPEVDALTLMAPDGYGGKYTRWIDSWLGFALDPVAALIAYPKPWLWLARLLAKVKVINPFALQFVEWQLGDTDSRARLQLTLRSLGQFRLRREDFQALNQWAGEGHSTTVRLGRRDRVVDGDRMEEIVDGLANVSWRMHEGGHWPSSDFITY